MSESMELYAQIDIASKSENCRMSESMELLTQIASELKWIQRLEDADCHNLKNCMHKSSMHANLEHVKCQIL